MTRIRFAHNVGQALQTDEGAFCFLFDNHPFPMWICDLASFAFLKVNQAAVNKYGYTHDEFLAMTLKDISPTQGALNSMTNVEDLQRSKAWCHRLKDGRIIEVDSTFHMLQFNGHKATLIAVQDETVRKETTRTRQTSALSMRRLADCNLIGSVVTDRIGHIVETNDLFLNMLGYTCNEVLSGVATHALNEEIAHIRRFSAASEAELTHKSARRVPVFVLGTLKEGENHITFMLDAHEPERAEERIDKLNRVHAMFSDINQAAIHTRRPQDLFERVCQIAVGSGGYRMACIGLIGEGIGQLKVVAHVGMNADDLEHLHASLNNDTAYRGMTHSHNGHGALLIDIRHASDATAWAEYTLPIDSRPSIALPLIVQGQTRAVLFLYRPATRLFDIPELKLLHQIATTISFALEFAEKETERSLAHDARRRNDRRFRKMIEYGGDVISLINEQGVIGFASESVTRILGYTVEEYVGLGPEVLVYPDDLPKVREVLESISAQSDATCSIEVRARHRDGYSIWMEVTLANLLHDPDVGAIVCNSRNISDRKQIEEALRESEARLRLLIQGVTEYAICLLDRQGHVALWNTGAERLKGYCSEEIIGRHISLFFSAEDQQDDKPQHLLAAAESQGHIEDEGWRIRKDGSRFWANAVLAALRRENGSLYGFAQITRDLTERKQIEQALRENQARLEGIIASAMDAIIGIDENQLIALFNVAAEHMFGYTAQEMIGQSIDRLIPERFRESHREHIRRFGQTGITNRSMSTLGTLYGLRTDGVEFPIEASISQLNIAEQKLYTVILRDINERKQAEEEVQQLTEELEQRVLERTSQLEATNKELEAFAYSVSHDLRAPLRAIDGFTRILVEEHKASLDSEGQRMCGIVRDETQRMGQLIDDLLAFSRLSRAAMQTVAIHMELLANSVFLELVASQDRDRIEFHLERLPNALGDPVLIRQVWINLLSNAIKFSSNRERARIEVGSREDASGCVYFVRDNGAGFDMQYADKLFTVFQRLHSDKEFDGTGVGLAIINRIITRHGGLVWAESIPDQGATFYFRL